MSSIGSSSGSTRPLSADEYKRYGRQMIMPGWGLPGQLKVKNARVAVVGAGGLGCPCLQYLTGAGVGTIGIVDHDTVDVSNLHRQVLHSTQTLGMNKARSASIAMKALNPHISVITHEVAVTPSNAISLLEAYDLIVDCTDRPLTRYLLSDASVLLSKALVSGAAISNAGQWAVYGGISANGERRACYRCMWPRIVGDGGGRCDEIGVWGPVVGMVGVAMAGEALRLIIGVQEEQHSLHLYHMGGIPLVRTIKIRRPSVKCIACGPDRTITNLESYDYDSFCSGPSGNPQSRANVERITAQDLGTLLAAQKADRVTVDTRPPVEYEICSLPGTINIPFDKIQKDPAIVPLAEETVFICRRGNDSLIAADTVQRSLAERGVGGKVKDVQGGLLAWSRDVDPSFPIY